MVRKAGQLEREGKIPLLLIGAGFSLLAGGLGLLIGSRVRVVTLEEAATYARLPIEAVRHELADRQIETYSRRGQLLVPMAAFEALKKR